MGISWFPPCKAQAPVRLSPSCTVLQRREVAGFLDLRSQEYWVPDTIALWSALVTPLPANTLWLPVKTLCRRRKTGFPANAS